MAAWRNMFSFGMPLISTVTPQFAGRIIQLYFANHLLL